MTDRPPPPISDILDDEPPPDRRRPDAADAAPIAEECRTLAAVRDLVAGLSRPRPPDLSAAVLRRIAARRRPRIAARAAAAAAVLVAGGLAVNSAARREAPGSLPPPAELFATEIAPADVVPSSVARAAVAAREPVGPPDDRPPIARRLLERPGPVRIFLATGSRPSDAGEVASLIGLSSHRDFHRFDLPAADGLPGATVFAAELDPGELRTLRMRLVDALPEGVDEQEAGPPLLVDVARSGTATTLRGDPAAEILVPRHELAIRLPSGEPSPAGRALPPPPAEQHPMPRESEGPSVVLVWLPGGGG